MFRQDKNAANETSPTPKLYKDVLTTIVQHTDFETKKVLTNVKELQAIANESSVEIPLANINPHHGSVEGSTHYTLLFKEAHLKEAAIKALQRAAEEYNEEGFTTPDNMEMRNTNIHLNFRLMLEVANRFALPVVVLLFVAHFGLTALSDDHKTILTSVGLGGAVGVTGYALYKFFRSTRREDQSLQAFHDQEALHAEMGTLSKKQK